MWSTDSPLRCSSAQLRRYLLRSQRIADAHAAAEREAAETAAAQEAALKAETAPGSTSKKSSASAKAAAKAGGSAASAGEAGALGAGDASGSRKPGSPSDTMALDEELSKQVFVEEAISTIGEAVADAAAEDGEGEFEFELELFAGEDSENEEMEVLHSLELSEMCRPQSAQCGSESLLRGAWK